MKGKSEVARYGENKSAYLGMKIEKASGPSSEGIIPESDNYEGEINHIEIKHERTRHRNEALTAEEHAILRSESGQLM